MNELHPLSAENLEVLKRIKGLVNWLVIHDSMSSQIDGYNASGKQVYKIWTLEGGQSGCRIMFSQYRKDGKELRGTLFHGSREKTLMNFHKIVRLLNATIRHARFDNINAAAKYVDSLIRNKEV